MADGFGFQFKLAVMIISIFAIAKIPEIEIHHHVWIFLGPVVEPAEILGAMEFTQAL